LLKRLSKDKVRRIHKRYDKARLELNVIQEKLMLDPINIQLQEQEQMLRKGYHDALSAPLLLRKQEG